MGDSVKRRITSIRDAEVCRPSPEIESAEAYFGMHRRVFARLPHDQIDQAKVELLRGYREGRTVFLFGNGGSAALASHFACDLGKGTIPGSNGQKRFRVMALTDNLPLITAWANDDSYEQIFAQQLQNFLNPGDIAFAISGSGNSKNVLRALEVARASQACTIGLTGFQGGKMKGLCDYCIVVPSDNMQVIEDFHLSICHALFLTVASAIQDYTVTAEPAPVYAKVR
jgi:D-sedoheptulose 7-phosphate isomerase